MRRLTDIRLPGLKTLDRYIIRKFLGTWIFAIMMFVVILVIFDYAEKVDDFITNKAPASAIWLEYYLNFIPSFINQFSGLLTFIAVIFFTSKLAYNTEIVAILSSGVSFRRLMWPYFISAATIMSLALALNLWIIPRAESHRVPFLQTYITRTRNVSQSYDNDIYRMISPGTFVYLRNFEGETQKASYFAIEHYEDGRLTEALEAADAAYSLKSGRWTAQKYTIRRIHEEGSVADSLPAGLVADSIHAAASEGVAGREEFQKFERLDTVINLNTAELGDVKNLTKMMGIGELNHFIAAQKKKGSDMMAVFEVERQSRFSYPVAILVLTLIGVSLSSRKVRGGTGLHMGLGIALCFTYILFSKFAEEFAKGGILPAALSVWMPNIIFAAVAVWLYIKAPK